MGPRPASEEGKPELTAAPWSQDHGAVGIPEGFRFRAPWKGCRGRCGSEEPQAAGFRSEGKGAVEPGQATSYYSRPSAQGFLSARTPE